MSNIKQIFVGIDPSLSSTGLYILFKNGQNHSYFSDYAQIDTKPSMFPNSINRCLYISDMIVSIIKENLNKYKDYSLQLIVCQDYFVGRQQGVVIQLAQLGTLIRYKLLNNNYPIIVVPPKTNKKYVTQNGNAKKDQMMQAVLQRWNFNASTDNLADACGMAHFAEFIYDFWDKPLQSIQKQIVKSYGKFLSKKSLIQIN